MGFFYSNQIIKIIYVQISKIWIKIKWISTLPYLAMDPIQLIWSCINTIPAKLAELIYSRLTLLFKTLPGYKLIMNNNHEIMQVAQVRVTR